MSKLSLTLHTFSVTGSVAGLFLTITFFCLTSVTKPRISSITWFYSKRMLNSFFANTDSKPWI